MTKWQELEIRKKATIWIPIGVKGKDLKETIRQLKKADNSRVYIIPEQDPNLYPAIKSFSYDKELEKAIFKTPKILSDKMVEKSITLEEDDEEEEEEK